MGVVFLHHKTDAHDKRRLDCCSHLWCYVRLAATATGQGTNSNLTRNLSNTLKSTYWAQKLKTNIEWFGEALSNWIDAVLGKSPWSSYAIFSVSARDSHTWLEPATTAAELKMTWDRRSPCTNPVNVAEGVTEHSLIK